MRLFITTYTITEDLKFEKIVVKLPSGEKATITFDESEYSFSDGILFSKHKGLRLDNKVWKTDVSKLSGMQVQGIAIHSDKKIYVTYRMVEMMFDDGLHIKIFTNPFRGRSVRACKKRR